MNLNADDIFTQENVNSTSQPGFLLNFANYREFKLLDKSLSQVISNLYEITTEQEVKYIPILPDGCMDIIFIIDNKGVKSYVIGIIPSVEGLYVGKNKHIIGIRFRPGGILQFLPVIPEEMKYSQIPLEMFFIESKQLYDELHNTNNFINRVDLIMKFLIKRMREFNCKDNLIHSCVNKIVFSKGMESVNELSDSTKYSTRYINKLFHKYLGLSPKTFSEIVRLQHTINYITNNQCNLLEIPYCCGYFDQSHMNRSFNKYLKISSKQVKENDFFCANHLKLNETFIL